MNILGLISQLIGIKTLRLTLSFKQYAKSSLKCAWRIKRRHVPLNILSFYSGISKQLTLCLFLTTFVTLYISIHSSFIHKQNMYIHIINSCVNTKLFHDVFNCINSYKLKNMKMAALHNLTRIYKGLAT